MSVETIKYKNKKYPIKLGYGALAKLQKEHGVTMDALEKDMDLYKPLIFYSLEVGHRIAKKELTLTEDDMVDFVEECYFDFLGLMPKFFPDVEKLMGLAGMMPQ